MDVIVVKNYNVIFRDVQIASVSAFFDDTTDTCSDEITVDF